MVEFVAAVPLPMVEIPPITSKIESDKNQESPEARITAGYFFGLW
jgi:hypothetical protein